MYDDQEVMRDHTKGLWYVISEGGHLYVVKSDAKVNKVQNVIQGPFIHYWQVELAFNIEREQGDPR